MAAIRDAMAMVACVLAGCEPITTRVIELAAEPDAGGGRRDARANSEAAVPRPGDASEPGVDATLNDAGFVDTEGCLVMPDQTIPQMVDDAAVAAQSLVIGQNAQAAGCGFEDGGTMVLSGSVFTRRDGEPMVKKGESYSYRWPADMAMGRINLVGGEEPCADQIVVRRAHGVVTSVGVTLATCYEFTAPMDARYVRTTGGDFYTLSWISLGAQPAPLQLCHAPCPPGTTHDFGAEDAGAPDAAPP